MEPVLSVKSLTKTFGGVRALDAVSLDFFPGLTAIVGDNGAGKSTLMKVLSGVELPDYGTIVLKGRPVVIKQAVDARRLGIESLYQDLALADTLNVVENVFLGREIVKRYFGIGVLDDRAMAKATKDTVSMVRIHLPDVYTPVRYLSGGQRQAVALARAMYFNASVLLLDEPTAALGPKETDAFNRVIKELVATDTTVIMVTHNIPQVMEMANRIVVMRAGRLVTVLDPHDTSEADLLAFMVGSKNGPQDELPGEGGAA